MNIPVSERMYLGAIHLTYLGGNIYIFSGKFCTGLMIGVLGHDSALVKAILGRGQPILMR